MRSLVEQRCAPLACTASPMTQEEIEEVKARLPNWRVACKDDAFYLERTFEFSDFPGALAFTQRIGLVAVREGHYPVLITEQSKVTVMCWTQLIQGLHLNDFIVAAKADRAYMWEI